MSSPPAESTGVRTRIEIGRSKDGVRWFRASVVVGDTREEIDQALAEALRLETELGG